MSKQFENLFCDNCHNLVFPTRIRNTNVHKMILECKICFSEKPIESGQRLFYSRSFQNSNKKTQVDNTIIQYDYTLKRINLRESNHSTPKEYVYILDSNLKQTLFETDFKSNVGPIELSSDVPPQAQSESESNSNDVVMID
jgi:DNA-directed RNA polymerase subunit M/transcription elongation factor TFIIS